MITLSIIVPSYNYPFGIRKILSEFSEVRRNAVELIISDDSTNDEVKSEVLKYNNSIGGNLVYIRNIPPLGAIRNWNESFKLARGKWVVFCHHDELISCADTLKLLNRLSIEHRKLAFIEAYVKKRGQSRPRLHCNNSLKFFLLRTFPEFFFVRNFVGPSAVLIFKRELYEKFDEALTWKVDVEWMYRMVRLANNDFANYKEISVFSSHQDGSITIKIKNDLNKIIKFETEYLALNINKYGDSAWLVLGGENFSRVFRCMIVLFWNFYRFIRLSWV